VQGESEVAEFKTSFQDKAIETLVAFANTRGGTVYIGVEDNGEVKGVKVGKETIQEWLNEIKIKTYPSLFPEVDLVDMDGKVIVAFVQNTYPIRPVAFRGKYYKRTGNANHQLSVSEVADMHLRTINSSWDYYIRKQMTTADISSEKVQRAIAVIAKRNPDYTIESVDEFLRKHELVQGDSITNGCFLMFTCQNTYHTTIQMGLFASETVIKDDVTSTADILSQVEDVMGFIVKHINKEIIITGRAENTERWQYPLEAIRELIINMIVHRDYTTGMHSTIKVFPDSIVFFNPGTLPGHITLSDLLSDKYVSSPRNLQVSKIFKEIGLIERYGTGIKRIRKLFLEHGLPDPEFKLIQDGFFVRVFASQVKIKDKLTEQVTGYGGVNVGVNVGANVGVNVGANKLLNIIEDNPGINAKKIYQFFEVTDRTIERWLKKLRDEGKIEFRGAAKTGGYWKVQE